MWYTGRSSLFVSCADLFMAASSSTSPGQWAAVRLTDGSIHRGVVYAVDPEVGHMVLLQPSDALDTVQPVILFASSIAHVRVAPTMADRADAVLPADAVLKRAGGDDDHLALDASTISLRLEAVCARLHAKHVPYEEKENGVLLVLGCLQVGPPYTLASCRCENEIVLDRFVEMISHPPLPGDVG